jgi:hypothetical protein
MATTPLPELNQLTMSDIAASAAARLIFSPSEL